MWVVAIIPDSARCMRQASDYLHFVGERTECRQMPRWGSGVPDIAPAVFPDILAGSLQRQDYDSQGEKKHEPPLLPPPGYGPLHTGLGGRWGA